MQATRGDLGDPLVCCVVFCCLATVVVVISCSSCPLCLDTGVERVAIVIVYEAYTRWLEYGQVESEKAENEKKKRRVHAAIDQTEVEAGASELDGGRVELHRRRQRPRRRRQRRRKGRSPGAKGANNAERNGMSASKRGK
jgi:hypothetical protein